MQVPGLQDASYGVFGLGKTGLAAARALQESGANVYVWDDSETACVAIEKQLPKVTCLPITDWPWGAMHEIVLSPGVPLTHPKPHALVRLAHEHKCACISDIELLYRANPNAYYIAITGTNGKSTTTSLVAHILQHAGKRVQVGGNLGIPVMDLQHAGEEGIYVLELSSYQLELLATTRFNVAVWLNISPDHLDRHGTMEGYIRAKTHIFDRQKKGDICVIGVDDPASNAVAHEQTKKSIARVISITTDAGIQQGIACHAGVLTNQYDGTTISLNDTRTLAGSHNGQNAAAAYAACMAAGLTHEEIEYGLKSFPGLTHRMQWLGTVRQVEFVNDSKATNADAAEKALLSYKNIYWLAGGVAKAGGIAALGHCFPHVRHAYLIGEASENFAETLSVHGVASTHFESLEEATHHAYKDACASGESSVVLLSPACASFDQFPNFETRGNVFIAEYEAIKATLIHEKSHAV